MRILLTGGAGYVGSHVARECLRAGHEPVIFDNYSSGHPEAVGGMPQIRGDLLDRDAIGGAFERFRFDAVLHFAAPDTSALSLSGPTDLYRAGIAGTLNLLEVMQQTGVAKLILSSTAADYASPTVLPITESHDAHPITPRGLSMLRIQQVLADLARQGRIRHITLRSFNVAGADPWGDIGEDRPGPLRLVPRLLLTALRQYDSFEIFGTDFETRDGTCVRDFVHVSDVAMGHILALDALDRCPGEIINLGSGAGYSVREVVDEAQRITETRVVVTQGARRPGDPPVLIASNEKARVLLEWEPVYSDLKTILETAWYWHKRHPQGFSKRDVWLDRDHDPDLSPEI